MPILSVAIFVAVVSGVPIVPTVPILHVAIVAAVVPGVPNNANCVNSGPVHHLARFLIRYNQCANCATCARCCSAGRDVQCARCANCANSTPCNHLARYARYVRCANLCQLCPLKSFWPYPCMQQSKIKKLYVRTNLGVLC